MRGINLNHAEFEDFMFRNVAVADFKAELVSARDLDVLRLSIEIKRGTVPAPVSDGLQTTVRDTFGLTPEVVVLDAGTLAKEFEASVKTPRFVRPATIEVPYAVRPDEFRTAEPEVARATAEIKKLNITEERVNMKIATHAGRHDGRSAVVERGARRRRSSKSAFITTLTGPPAVLGRQLKNGFHARP